MRGAEHSAISGVTGGEFLAVLAAVVEHVRLVVPGGDAGRLHRRLMAQPW
jgi:hypothetical protein